MEQIAITPAHNNVLCKQHEEEEKMYGRIIIADNGKEKPLIAEVIATGPGTWILGTSSIAPMFSQVGDLVIIPSFGGQKVSYDGVDYIMMKDTDILGKINKKTNE